ncbi:transposase [Thiohalocapsa marina]|uniref:Transposase n=1 Tax=Thiohalocapsa marina TaxID=424902 RepID=A0A5M8FP93_9GAMM|nr:transposase [Thiohalocapsa marina]KAA6184245.1 transposase [Thiohalocapsa marina]
MATTYSPEFKADLIAKMLPPQSRPVLELARESGVPKDTLYCWRGKALAGGSPPAETRSRPAQDWPPKARFQAVLETAAMNAEQTAAYCRRRGLYPEQLAQWRTACEQATSPPTPPARHALEEAKAQRARIRELERELQRKNAALAETAALLALKKNVWSAPVVQVPSARC